MNSKIRVLVVDDSAFFRRRITEMLCHDQDIEVIATANDGMEALKEARRLKPDVITMDVEMPVMDGITAVKRIMAVAPTPILMFSSVTREGAKATLDALAAGAVDFLPKRADSDSGDEESIEQMLLRRVRVLGKKQRGRVQVSAAPPTPAVRPQVAIEAPPLQKGRYKLVAIGASTGGPVAVQELLAELPAGFPLPVLVVVHMPASFTPAYAERLNAQCSVNVKEAVDRDRLEPGQVYLAPGGKQMLLEQKGTDTFIRIRESAAGQTYRPCVDVTLGSASRVFPDSVLAVVMTGMGSDGMQGARLLKEGGSTVWSQDKESCVVYGMPQAVEKAGLSDRVLALNQIGPSLGEIA
jgi:two-component system chemotaxis response regulator CheB